MTIYKNKKEAIKGRKLKDKDRYIKNREERIKKQKLYDSKHLKEKSTNNKKIWSSIKNNPDRLKKCREREKIFREKRKLEVLSYYSNGKLECSCCKENIYQFLSIDHINGGGSKHRKTVSGSAFYRWLRKNNYPKGFQVLCFNCNWGKRNNIKCPHQDKIL